MTILQIMEIENNNTNIINHANYASHTNFGTIASMEHMRSCLLCTRHQALGPWTYGKCLS